MIYACAAAAENSRSAVLNALEGRVASEILEGAVDCFNGGNDSRDRHVLPTGLG